jgi:hypothetical protein
VLQLRFWYSICAMRQQATADQQRWKGKQHEKIIQIEIPHCAGRL